MNNLLLSLFLLLVLLSAFECHRHRHKHHKKHKHHKHGVKKIVKIINVPAPIPKQKASSSSSSSSSSEEVEKILVGANRPTLAPPPLPPPTCEKGWLTFNRKNGRWCVLVGGKGADKDFSHADAEKMCKEHHATLTGLQNDKERMEVANEGLHQLGEFGAEIGGIWLGATNYADCRVESCGALKTFKWTDGETTGTDGFKWGNGEPDNKDWGGSSACVQQFIMSPTWKATTDEMDDWMDHYKHGDLDKYKCTTPTGPKTRLFACGKIAEHKVRM